MKLLIKQRVFSWTDTYDVYNEEGSPKYHVWAELFRIGHVINICDMQGNVMGCVRERLLTLLPKFELEVGGRALGLIRKEFTLFRPRYQLDCNGWQVHGDFFAWDYDVLDGQNTVMQIAKRLFTWGDTYELDIRREQDELLCVMIAIAIDAANCGSN